MSEQRVQRIGAENIVAERAGIAERKLAAERKKVEDNATKINGTLKNAALCEAKLASLSGGHFTTATIENVAKVGAPLLRVQEPVRSVRVLGPRVVTGHHRSVLSELGGRLRPPVQRVGR